MDTQSNISLHLVNRSDDIDPTSIAIFQRNAARANEQPAPIAWKVIPYCGHNDVCPFVLEARTTIAVVDGYGNRTPKIDATLGQAYLYQLSDTGYTLTAAGAAPNQYAFQVRWEDSLHPLKIQVYRSDLLLAEETGVAIDGEAYFNFWPEIWIGPGVGLEEGGTIAPANLNSFSPLGLEGVKRARIMMTGGGVGAQARPYRFALENIVRA